MFWKYRSSILPFQNLLLITRVQWGRETHSYTFWVYLDSISIFSPFEFVLRQGGRLNIPSVAAKLGNPCRGEYKPELNPHFFSSFLILTFHQTGQIHTEQKLNTRINAIQFVAAKIKLKRMNEKSDKYNTLLVKPFYEYTNTISLPAWPFEENICSLFCWYLWFRLGVYF